jgi:hypothetical protein
MTTFAISWAILGFATLALALYRIILALHEDDYVHLAAGEQHLIPAQEASFRKLGLIDRWGVALTVGTILYGLVLVAFYLYPLFLNQYR